MFHLACLDDGRVVGAAAMHDDSRLFQFFVSTRSQRHGIARQLSRRSLRDAQQREAACHFTLNSSAMAGSVYLKSGFVRSGSRKANHVGLIARPMRLDLT
ncbi:MAG: GNAT family N-acetyltransferase [Rhodanobacter sp.]